MIELHRKMLADQVRNRAFHEALKRVIKPGQTIVADIGAGTGFLSFLASRLGAKACYLYEHDDSIAVAKEIAKRSGIRNCTFIQKHSADVAKPAKVDLVISETLGNFAYEENIIENIEDAKRMLKPGGTIMPARLTQYIAPVITDRLYREINIWDRVGFDFDWTPAREVTLNNMYVKTVRPDELLEAGKQWDKVIFEERNGSIRKGDLEWQSDKQHTIYGFALWWECELAESVTLSTSPSAPATHWEQIFLPLLEPLSVKTGQCIRLALISDSRYSVKINVKWETSLVDGRGKVLATQQQDMRKGHLN